VHLFGGYALTGAFCWLLTADIYRRSGQRRMAAILFGINTLIFAAMIGSTMQLEMAWWRLDSMTMALNLVWALSAWLVQYFRFGPARRRYDPAQWRRWLSPLFIGILLGLGYSISAAVMPAIGDRIAALEDGQTAMRSVVLWDFFKNLLPGLVVGLLAGAWWAGQRRFTVSHVVCFLTGIALFFTSQSLAFGLVTLLINGGSIASLHMFANDAWSLVPGRLHGWQRLIDTIGDYNYIAFVPVGMLFGTHGRIRDFLKRSAVVVPSLVLLALSFSFSTQTGWMMLQGHIIHRTASPDDQERASAFDLLSLMLARYPDHAQWPHLAARLADFHYSQGDFEIARNLHQRIFDRFSDSNRWHVQAAMSRAILAESKFGQPSKGPRLSIPMVNYQNYLSRNWMALLAAVRYWEAEETPISELFIRLRNISKNDDAIKLPKLTGLAELDDAASALGYDLTILPAGAEASRRLVEAGLPVILPVYQTFYLLYGFDDSRGVVQALCFGQLSQKTKSLAVKEAQDVLMLETEGKRQTKDQLMRIRREADCMWHLDQWCAGRLKDAAPWMAVVHPDKMRPKIAAALGRDAHDLYRIHRGHLAAMIALNYFDNADPINCIRWAGIAGRHIDAPYIYQTAHLGAELWRHRTERIGMAFQLEEKFAALGEVNRYLQIAAVREFLQAANERFKADLDAGRINWPIRRRLLWMLDRNDPRQRTQMISLLRENVSTNPADADQWRLLTDLYAIDENTAARAQTLSQAWSAAPHDTTTALAWASTCVRLNDLAQAELILKNIDVSKVRHKAEYPFCLGAVAEWKQQPRKALRYYAQAIDMCRYRPEYFLRYGRLIKAQGDSDAARKALTWAARIDGGDLVRKQAENVLKQ
jgi:tetratricopeptide (TPR) repeat protein